MIRCGNRRACAALAKLTLFCLIPPGGGCNRLPESGGPTQLPARQNNYVEDIPVPANFTIVEAQSRSKTLATPAVRWVDHLYRGRGDAMAVRGFYAIRMAEHKWEPISETINEGVYTMRFKKGPEVCEITVSRARLLGPVGIHVALEPQESGNAPRQPK